VGEVFQARFTIFAPYRHNNSEIAQNPSSLGTIVALTCPVIAHMDKNHRLKSAPQHFSSFKFYSTPSRSLQGHPG
jgi:hypothetical protein